MGLDDQHIQLTDFYECVRCSAAWALLKVFSILDCCSGSLCVYKKTKITFPHARTHTLNISIWTHAVLLNLL